MRAWCVGFGLVMAACQSGESRPSQPACMEQGCACQADTTACDGTCVDIASDPANCGSCGHDCLGTACVEGLCWPETLAAAPNAPAAIGLQRDAVVFATGGAVTSSGAVYRVAKTGGGLEVVHRGLGAEPALAVTADTIVVSDSQQAQACKAFSSAGSIFAITDDGAMLRSMGRRCARWLLPYSDGLTWLEEAPISVRVLGDPGPWIARLPNGAPADTPPTELYARRLHGIGGLVQSGATMIWRELTAGADSLVRMQLAGGGANRLVSLSNKSAIVAYAADAEHLAYARQSSDGWFEQVVVRSLAAPGEKTVAEVFGDIRRVAIDPSFVYWIEDGDVWAVDLLSSRSRRLADGGTARELAHDDRFLYVLRFGQRGAHQTEVIRIRKPASIGSAVIDPFENCSGPLHTCPAADSLTQCFDITTDPDHCGDCKTTCGAGELCADGACTCAATSLVCADGCVDPASDAANCGRCGRDCGGGACVEGDCTPVRIGEAAHAAVQDASALYYAAGNRVKRLDKRSTTATTLAQLTLPFGFPNELASDATRLYVVATSGRTGGADAGTIYALAKDGSGPPTALYADRPDPRHIAVAGDTVLWVEDASDTTDAPATLVHAASASSSIRGSFQPLGLYPGAQDDESRDVVVAGSVVYWLLADPTQRRGAIVRIDLGAASPRATLVATLDREPETFTIVDDQIHVTTRGTDGALLSIPARGGAVSVQATGLVDAGAIESTTDGSLYWVDGTFSEKVIHQRAPGDVAPRVVQMAPPGRSTIVLVDGDRLYTASDSGIFVMTR